MYIAFCYMILLILYKRTRDSRNVHFYYLFLTELSNIRDLLHMGPYN